MLALFGVFGATAQTEWRHLGGSAVESHFAGPVTGPMVQVWYAEDGATLYARTDSGKTYQTQDFETWVPAVPAPSAPAIFARDPIRKPEDGARYIAAAASSQELWGLGRQLYHSNDGKNWESLTAYKSESVVGPGLHSVAVSPNDPSQLAVANDEGVWRSMDNGLTWASLNLQLPNLAVQRILATPSGGHSAQITTQNEVLELVPGSSVWRQLNTPRLQAESATKITYSAKIGASVSTFVQSSDLRTVYAGSDDGRIWRSVDNGLSFQPTGQITAVTGHRVERLFLDPANSLVVLAALSGEGSHVLRTFNGGTFWDPLDSKSLPNVSAYSVTADRASNAVYVATDQGVYWAHFDMESGGTTTDIAWTKISEHLPQAKALDVALDPAGVQLYVALEGYGVFGAPAPHRATGLRLVNTADYSTRAASPGSLVSVLGEKVNSVSSGALQYPVFYNSQIQVPFEAVGPTVSLALETATGRMTRDLQVQPVSPAIFVGSDGTPMILDADSGNTLDHNVAHPGQRLQVMVNGLGRVRPDWQTGVVAPAENTPVVVAKMQAYLDRSEVPVTTATLAPGYVGMYLVEVQLPVVANYGSMELHIAADGHESNHVQILIVQ